MSGMFDASVEVDRPVEQVFAYLADGRNDPDFSPGSSRSRRPRTAPPPSEPSSAAR